MNLPDPLSWAVPMFAVLVIAEMVRAKQKSDVRYEAKDATASLMMGFGNTVARLLFGGISIAATLWASSFAIFDIGYVWWAFITCFFLEDLSYTPSIK